MGNTNFVLRTFVALFFAAVFGLGAAFYEQMAREVRLSAPSEKKPAVVVLREDIFKDAPFSQCHASTVVETKSGLVAAWFGGTKEGNPDIGIWLSRHNGSAWSAPAEVASGRGSKGECQPCWNPVLFLPKEGPLLLFYKVGPSPSRWWGMITTSEDDGLTWAAPQRLPESIYGPIKNHPLEFSDGKILCGSSTERGGWRVHFEWTSDRGRTWERTDAINDGNAFGVIQPALLRIGERSVLALLRSTAERVYATRSEDQGWTWTQPKSLSLPNPNSGLDAVTLRDGRHVLVCNPTTRGRSPLSVLICVDGDTWTPVLTLENERGAEFSYPAVIQSRDGLVHITYTWKRYTIRHVVIDLANHEGRDSMSTRSIISNP